MEFWKKDSLRYTLITRAPEQKKVLEKLCQSLGINESEVSASSVQGIRQIHSLVEGKVQGRVVLTRG